MITDKICVCRFCCDYSWLTKELLPNVPEEHRKRLENFFEWAWNVDEELGYKTAILSGGWPDSVEFLKRALHKAEAFAAPAEEKKA